MSADHSAEHVDQLTTISKAKGFLGRDFLTWLWYTAETSRESLSLQADGKAQELDLWVDDRVVLEASGSVTQQSVMKGGDPSQTREAAAALATGKTVRELKVGMNVKGHGEFTAILSAEDLSPRSLKLPNPNGDGSAKAADELPIAARLRHMDLFLGLLDALFLRFLEARTAEDWEKSTLSDIRAWIKQRQKASDAGTLH